MEKIRLLTSPDNPLQPARQASLHVMRKRRDDAPTKSFPNLFLCWVNVPIRLLHPLWIKCPDRWSTLIIETGWDWPPALTWFVFPCFVDLNIGLRIYLEVESRYCAMHNVHRVIDIWQAWTSVVIRVAQLAASLHSGCEKMREGESGERFALYISSFSLYFLPLYIFPISKTVTFCLKMVNTALLSRLSKNLTTLWENNSWVEFATTRFQLILPVPDQKP